MARYTGVFCRSYSLDTGIRVIAWFYIVNYLFNISLNIFILDIVKSYKETMDEDLEYSETNLRAFHYIFIAFGIMTILLAIATLVNLSKQSEYFMEFMFQCNIFRCIVLFVGIVYVCIAMRHILTVSLSCSLLVVDLCFSCYAIGIIASFNKSIGDPSELETQESNDVKCGEVHLVSHKKTSDLGQAPQVVVDCASGVACKTNGGIENAGLDSEGEREVKEKGALSGDAISKEPTKAPQAETEGDVTPNEEKTLDTNRESTTVLVHAGRKDSTPPEKRDGHVSVLISENDSTFNKEQNVVTINVNPKNSDLHPSDSDLAIETPSGNKADSDPPKDVGLKNAAFEEAEFSQKNAAIETPRGAIVMNVKVGDEAGGLDAEEEIVKEDKF